MVIVGGGFGGLHAARELADAPVDITVIDRHNHHLFQPLLYQVATASLNPSEIAAPIRRILRKQSNVEVVLGNVVGVDRKARKVLLVDGEVSYDYLILATGASHSYFGNDDWAAHAPGLKTISDALELRRKIFIAFEAAEREQHDDHREAWMTFVIVGAGPTGVELAGALAEIARRTLRSDFRHIDPRSARILLVEGAPRVLPAMRERLSRKAKHQLERLGVQVRTSAQVTCIDETGVSIGQEHIYSHTVFWAAGVAASPVGKTLGVPLDRAGRVLVNPDLTLPGDDRVYVVGDLASLQQKGKPVPGVAPAAMQQGRHAAQNIVRVTDGQATEPFYYFDKGTLATIGRLSGVADIRGFQLSGALAWLAWLLVHIWFLIGFRNRLVVLLEWARAYLTYERQARLITEQVNDLLSEPLPAEAKRPGSAA
ncbi:MAG TPA: NAD(P)/FAD-dependent oxidoreductase [Actinomycetota bacterium]|nr:NAD(P)/FAD-dependent oxidoreductase [Actinomycetota bacterium]